MNGLAILVAGIYLVVVSLRGNASAFITQVQNEVGFLKWIGSVLIVYWIWKYKPFGDTISEIAGIGFAAVFLKMWPSISKAMGFKDAAAK